jgi:uncharacterized protein YjdB
MKPEQGIPESAVRDEPLAIEPPVDGGALIGPEEGEISLPLRGAEAETERGKPAMPGSKKPILAGLAIAGTMLIVAPILLLGNGDKKTSNLTSGATQGNTIPTFEQPGDPISESTSFSPSPSPSPKEGSKAKSADKSPSAAPTVAAKVARSSKSAIAAGSAMPKKKSKGEKKNAPPPAGTAAAAVEKLAASSPGRHICYRVHVSDIGWKSPVCDGAMAGTVGQARAIEAINISVAGVDEVAARGYIQNAGWEASGKTVPDDVNLYIGTTGLSLRLEAFTLNVGTGTVCVNSHVQNIGWQGAQCGRSGSDVTAGTMGKSLRLEAVTFTV